MDIRKFGYIRVSSKDQIEETRQKSSLCSTGAKDF